MKLKLTEKIKFYEEILSSDNHKKLDKLYDEREISDGFDMAFFDGFDSILKEYDCFNGQGDGGITENYIKGIKTALKKLDEIQTHIKGDIACVD